MNIRRGDIVVVDLVDSIGSVQQGKGRPCIVIQNNVGNKYSPTTIVVSLTSSCTKPKIPTHVGLETNEYNRLMHDSIALCEQPISIDKSQIIDKGGRVTTPKMEEINHAIAISMGLIEMKDW